MTIRSSQVSGDHAESVWERHADYEGTFLSDKLQRAVLLAVLKEAGLTSADQDLPASVRVKHGQNRNGKTLHFYLNYSSSRRH